MILSSPANWATTDWTMFAIFVFAGLVVTIVLIVKIVMTFERPARSFVMARAEEVIQKHNLAPDSHAIKFGNDREFLRAHTAEAIMLHDESKKAHVEALEGYISRIEFNGAMRRLEEMHATLHTRLSELKDDFHSEIETVKEILKEDR